MENIYQETIRDVEDGAKFKIDFQSRSLKLNGKYIIQDGEFEGNLGVEPSIDTDEFLSQVEKLYYRYKNSIPSERSESKSRLYFRALPERKLSDDAMLFGEHREKAQFELELYVLCQILNGFKWESEKMGKWFWQSKMDKDLVILKKWVDPDVN